MLEKITNLAHMGEWPEEVQHEINEYEGMGRELVYVEHIQQEEFGYKDDYWTIVYFEPLTGGETSPYDVFWFASLSYTSWPKPSLFKYFYSFHRNVAEMLAKHEGRKPVEREEVA